MSTELGSANDHQRPVPEDSGAMACLGFSWAEIVELLSERIAQSAPEVTRKRTIWSVHARANGVRILFFDDDDAHARFLRANVQPAGPQVHAGRMVG